MAKRIMKSLFDFAADIVNKNKAELASIKEGPTDETEFRERYRSVLDFSVPVPMPRYYDFGQLAQEIRTAASLRAGRKHAMLPLALVDAYVASLPTPAYKQFMYRLIDDVECIDGICGISGADAVLWQGTKYVVEYSTAIKRSHKLYGELCQIMSHSKFDVAWYGEDVSTVCSYRSAFLLFPDHLMISLVLKPAKFQEYPYWSYRTERACHMRTYDESDLEEFMLRNKIGNALAQHAEEIVEAIIKAMRGQ